jgi:peptide deformylase
MGKVLPIVLSPDPILNMVSKPVSKVDDNLRKFMDDMLTTMYNAHGIGLAAVQVGELKRVLTMDTTYEADDSHIHSIDGNCCDGKVAIRNPNPIYMVNPEIIEKSEELYTYKEGCLSFPEAFSNVDRPKKVKIKFLDYHGKEKQLEFEGILAVCTQHEIDHLDGITFVDHISRIKRQLILKKIVKRKKELMEGW